MIALDNVAHDPGTNRPHKGHVVSFLDTDDGNVWYGLCCGDFTEQDVFGTHGLACPIMWFDRSHSGDWKGVAAEYYELTTCVQPQLRAAMDDWGHLLLYDPDLKMFVKPDEDDNELDENTAASIEPAAWFDALIANTEAECSGGTASREELLLLQALCPIRLQFFIDNVTRKPTLPSTCGTDDSKKCQWQTPFAREFSKLPVCMPCGPCFLRPVRYRCSTHGKFIQAGSKGGPQQDPSIVLNINPYRLKDMHYDRAFVRELQAMYIEDLTAESVRRRIISRWGTSCLQAMELLKQSQNSLGLRTTFLQRASRLTLVMSELAPSAKSIIELQLVLFQTTVAPLIPEYDKAVAAFDGQLLRVDGTFRTAARVMVHDPAARGVSNRPISKSVFGAVLVVIGLEGLNLVTPRIVPAESKQHLKAIVEYVMRNRRDVLGSLGAPVGFCTDSIQKHRLFLRDSLYMIFPELRAARGHPFGTPGPTEDDEMDDLLMLQDIPHREWAFTEKAAKPKTHGDYKEYRLDIKRVFRQLRLCYKAIAGPDIEDLVRYWRDALRQEAAREGYSYVTTEQGLQDCLRTGILNHPASNQECDFGTRHALLYLNANACEVFTGLLGYIPPRYLARAARRLSLPPATVALIDAERGYKDSDDFLHHLEQVNVFYKTPRSLARQKTASSVISQLASTPAAAGHIAPGKKRKRQLAPARAQGNADEDDVPSVYSDWTGIADNEHVMHALITLQDANVVKQPPTMRVLSHDT